MQELNPIEWAVRPLQRYANFNGRAPRAEYWWYYLLTVVLSIPVSLLDTAFGLNRSLGVVLQLALFLPTLAVTVRRLHDTNRSGAWLLLFVAGFVVVALVAVGASGLIVGSNMSGLPTLMVLMLLMLLGVVVTYIVFMALPGTKGQNDYGPDPYGPNDLEVVFE